MTEPPVTQPDEPARCLIVDDEAPAREELRFLLQGVQDRVRVLGEATNAREAVELLRSIDYDLVLLDIHLPGGSGLDVAREIKSHQRRPAVVFTTAYADHAVDAFELQAADYVMKPIERDRLLTAIDRALEDRAWQDRPSGPAREDTDTGWAPASKSVPAPGATRIPVQQGDRTVLVTAADIISASATRGYSYLNLPDERYLVSYSLTELEERLGPSFFRAHRSHLVNLSHVAELVPDFRGTLTLVMDDGPRSRVEVSRRQTGALRKALGMA